MSDDDNIIRLAELQDAASCRRPAEEAIALRVRGTARRLELRHVASLGPLAELRRHRAGGPTTPCTPSTVRARSAAKWRPAARSRPARSHRAKTVAAVERLAKADRRLAATATQWDADGWAFNTGEHDNDRRDV